MPCTNPCRLYIHLASTYSVGPSSIVWSKLGPAPPFPPIVVVTGSWSRVWSDPKMRYIQQGETTRIGMQWLWMCYNLACFFICVGGDCLPRWLIQSETGFTVLSCSMMCSLPIFDLWWFAIKVTSPTMHVPMRFGKKMIVFPSLCFVCNVSNRTFEDAYVEAK